MLNSIISRKRAAASDDDDLVITTRKISYEEAQEALKGAIQMHLEEKDVKSISFEDAFGMSLDEDEEDTE